MLRYKNNGFTLIEVLLAMSIFAVLALLSTVSIQRLINTHQLHSEKTRQLQELRGAYILLTRDLQQMINRPVRDAYGSILPAFVGQSDIMDPLSGGWNDLPGRLVFAFTRGGVMNVQHVVYKKSSLLRVVYMFDSNQLVRYVYGDVDRSSRSGWQRQVVIRDIDDIRVVYWDVFAMLQERNWTTGIMGVIEQDMFTDNSAFTTLPKGITIQLFIEDIGNIEWVLRTPITTAEVII